ncbi:MAG: chemotaxis protein CheW [Anaerolineae bacterium]
MTLTQSQLLNGNHHRGSDIQSSLLNLESQLANYQAEDGLSLTTLAAILTKRAQNLATVPPEPPTGQTLNLLVFQLGQERYGIDVQHVREIYPRQPLTPVPRTPDFVAGIFSARGRILSVVNLKQFLGLPSAQSRESDQDKIIVVANTNSTTDMAQMEVGFLVDEVTDLVTIFEDEVGLSLATHTGANYVRGITADLLVVLDLSVLLSDERLVVYEELL